MTVILLRHGSGVGTAWLLAWVRSTAAAPIFTANQFRKGIGLEYILKNSSLAVTKIGLRWMDGWMDGWDGCMYVCLRLCHTNQIASSMYTMYYVSQSNFRFYNGIT